MSSVFFFTYFFFNDTATTWIYTYGHTRSLQRRSSDLGGRGHRRDVRGRRTRRTQPGGAAQRRQRGPARAARPVLPAARRRPDHRSEEHTSEIQSLMRISYAVFCLKKKTTTITTNTQNSTHQHSHTVTSANSTCT